MKQSPKFNPSTTVCKPVDFAKATFAFTPSYFPKFSEATNDFKPSESGTFQNFQT